MSDIAAFLRARYAEQRALAEATAEDAGKDWSPGDEHLSSSVNDADTGAAVVIGPWEYLGWDTRRHVAAHDPAAVIADLDAKLAIVDEVDYDPPVTDGATDQELHTRCAHPGWEYRTTTGPRKQWDGVDDPPCDDNGDPEPGWERNVDAGLPGEGWERFDYTEESYWRRPRPDGPREPRSPRVLRLLAQPFAGHPDHKGEEWAP
ncbi:DUF6221 family protein [Streptomyces tendae]